MSGPFTTKMNWLESIRKNSFWLLIVYLIVGYLLVTIGFAFIYNEYALFEELEVVQSSNDDGVRKPEIMAKNEKVINNNFLDSFYFSVVTGTTLGFGDFTPKNKEGKWTVIVHVLLSTAFFAFSVSIIFLKFLYPRNTIILSKKIMYLRHEKKLIFRAINVNRAKLINPEFRIVLAKHTEKGRVSHHVSIMKIDDIPILGNHDFIFNVYGLPDDFYDQILIVRDYNKKAESEDQKSRFSIKISVSGSYGFTSYSHYHKYKEPDIVEGNLFEHIEYPENFHKKMWKYKSIPLFWEKFHGMQ